MYVPPKEMSRTVNLVAGRMPDPSSPDEVLASFNLQRDNGVHVGTVLRMRMYAASQSEAVNQASGAGPAPTGPFVSFHVVGLEAAVYEFRAGTTPLYDIYTTPAFARTVLPKTTSGFIYLVKLRHGAADVDAFKNYVKSLGVSTFTDVSTPEALVANSIHPQAVGWWLLAALAALAGAAVVGQALSRTRRVESDEFPILRALGLGRSSLVALGMASTLLVGLVGAAGALAFALALSPLAPVGDARLAESSSGLHFDGPVLLLGAAATVAVVLVLGVWPALRSARGPAEAVRHARPSAVVRIVGAAGAPPAMVVGVRNALERGSGTASAPIATALLGAALAVAALCGTAVFGSSLAHLDATPSLFGDTYQVIIYGTPSTSSTASPEADQRQVIRGLERHKGIDRITIATGAPISIDSVTVQAGAFATVRGPPLLVAITGRLPDRPGEIALGSSTMRLVGTSAGAVVPVRFGSPGGRARSVPFRVVGTAALPTDVGDGEVGLGTGAVLTLGGYEQAACPHGTAHAKCVGSILGNTAVLASAAGGSGHAAIEHIISADQNYVETPLTPTTLVNFGEAVDFPLILGLILAIFGAATLAHLLIVSVGRRRREMGLLKALGFLSRQVGATVYWQATTVTLVGLCRRCPGRPRARSGGLAGLRLQRRRRAGPGRRSLGHRGPGRDRPDGRAGACHRPGVGGGAGAPRPAAPGGMTGTVPVQWRTHSANSTTTPGPSRNTSLRSWNPKTSLRGVTPCSERWVSMASRSLTPKQTWLNPVRVRVPAPSSTAAAGWWNESSWTSWWTGAPSSTRVTWSASQSGMPM